MKRNYHSHVDKYICLKFQSNTLNDVLSGVNQKIGQSLPALLIVNIVTAAVKNLVKAFYYFGVRCSYGDSRNRLHSGNMDLTGLQREVDSLIQGVGDNFDQQICSQNGKLQTHSIALLMTQTDDARKQDNKEDRIPRLAKSDMVRQIPYDI